MMKTPDIAQLRLNNQRITAAAFKKPGDVVEWLGAVQAQDYLGALWAVGLRMQNAIEADIEKALADKTIIRTWPMRGTLHFVAATDIRWMLELMTPRIVAREARRLHRQMGLDEDVFTRSKKIFERALRGGKQLSRNAMYQVLEAEKIHTGDQRGLHILSRLAQDGFICFGAREGNQQTFALLDEWAPGAKRMKRDEALAEIARRYFTSHGPASLQDFVWWTGLTMTDAKTALEMARPRLAQEEIDGKTYWIPSSIPATKESSPAVYLLPAFDEYTVAYKDRSAVLNRSYAKQAPSGASVLSPTIVVDGQVAGVWKRSIKKDSVLISPTHFAKLDKDETRKLEAAAKRYGDFIGAKVVLT